MRVELLYFDGCPNYEGLVPQLRQLLDRAGIGSEVELRRVASEEDARRLRFLGSPTVRIDGRDVEEGAAGREDFGLKCRLYRTPSGLVGSPPGEWIAATVAVAVESSTSEPIAERLGDLPEPYRELHRSVLRAFVHGHAPEADDLRRLAGELDVDLVAALAELERRDALWVDQESGAVSVAYPFSGSPTAHEVTIASTGVRAFAMCALDALGVAFMIGEPALVRSRDPIGREPIEASIDPTGTHSWEPAGAVVVAAVSGGGPSAASCCPNVNFIADRERAHELLAEPGAPAGTLLAMPEAIELGRRIFGSLLDHA